MSATPPAPPASACPNCFHAYPGAQPKFCPECGQETHVRPPRVVEFLQQIGGAYLATEGALWRTLKLLLLQPGELTAQYLAGRRKHYVLPLRLFLSITVLMLLTMRVVGSLEAVDFDDPEVRRALPERPSSMHIELGFGQAGLQDGSFYCENLPPWLCRRIERRVDTDTRSLVMQMQRVSERVASHAGAAAFVLLPAFAVGLWLLFWRRGLHYTEHLVFAVHVHAFWFLLAALMMLGVEVLVWAGALMMPVYGLLAMRRVYGGPWWALALRAVVLGAVHLALVALTVAAVTLAALLL
ncbi:MAG: DUF3667 domain-containing protein [Rubrivivax sp.]|nr:DUF3667 domain-containing protein [Rubrivivax sp.]